jgi:hypothetical protein
MIGIVSAPDPVPDAPVQFSKGSKNRTPEVFFTVGPERIGVPSFEVLCLSIDLIEPIPQVLVSSFLTRRFMSLARKPPKSLLKPAPVSRMIGEISKLIGNSHRLAADEFVSSEKGPISKRIGHFSRTTLPVIEATQVYVRKKKGHMFSHRVRIGVLQIQVPQRIPCAGCFDGGGDIRIPRLGEAIQEPFCLVRSKHPDCPDTGQCDGFGEILF